MERSTWILLISIPALMARACRHDRFVIDVEAGGRDVFGVVAAAKEKRQLRQHRDPGRFSVFGHRETDEPHAPDGGRRASLAPRASLGVLETAPHGREREAGREHHAVGDLARKLQQGPKFPCIEGQSGSYRARRSTLGAERNRATLSGVPGFGNATTSMHEKEHHHGQADCDGRDRRHPPRI
jgi:hypothetical protein